MIFEGIDNALEMLQQLEDSLIKDDSGLSDTIDKSSGTTQRAPQEKRPNRIVDFGPLSEEKVRKESEKRNQDDTAYNDIEILKEFDDQSMVSFLDQS